MVENAREYHISNITKLQNKGLYAVPVTLLRKARNHPGKSSWRNSIYFTYLAKSTSV